MVRQASAPAEDDVSRWPHYADYYPVGSRQDLEFRLTYRLVLTARLWMKLIDRILRMRAEQSRARWETMFAIAFAEGPVTTRSVSQHLRLRWPTLVRVLDELERDGLIERTDNPADGRSRLIRLSPRGREVLIQSREAVDPKRHEALEHLSDADLATCTELLDRVFQVLDAAGK